MSSLYDRTGKNLLVIHHLGDGLGPALTKEEVFRRANPKGYQFPEYDFGILGDGTVISMRPLNYIGAHTQADKEEYMRGDNWWNMNSASVVMANDNTKFPPPHEMLSGLEGFLVAWCKEKGATINDLYPHFQITRTDCPGGKYSKLNLDTGYFDYDRMEERVLEQTGTPTQAEPQLETQAQEHDSKPGIILEYGSDAEGALRLAQKLDIPIYPRSGKAWEELTGGYVVGGSPMNDPKFKDLTGDGWIETVKKVIAELEG